MTVSAQIILMALNVIFGRITIGKSECFVYGLKSEVWFRVVPDPWAELQVDPAQGSGTVFSK